MTSPAASSRAGRSRRSLARASLLALAGLTVLAALGCEEDRGTAVTTPASSAAPQATTAAAPTSMASAGSEAAAAPSGIAVAEAPATTVSATANLPPVASAAPKETGAKPTATKPPKDPSTSGTSKTSAADAGAGDAGGAIAQGEPPPSAGTSSPSPDAPLPPAAPGSADAIAADIDAIFTGKKTFKSTFKQEHTQKVTGAAKKSSGTVFIEKPNKLSFRYDAPNKNRIVSDGTLLKVYIAEDEQMFTQPVGKSQYPGALSFLMGNGLRPSFTFTIHDKAKFEGGPVLNGKPRAPTPYYEYVLFYVDKALLEKKDPGVIRRVLVVDAQGNKNRFDFENVSQPATIDASEFTFTPPPGTNIQEAKK